MRTKYGSKKTILDGQVFDSRREARRYMELKWLERAGEISDLKTQVGFELIPAQTDERGKVVECAVKYVADFVYKDKNGDTVIEDAKGFCTREYVLKRKLMLFRYGFRIIEV